MEQLYAERLKRYVTAMRNEKPDRVPIRPFVAEFTGKYAGYTCQELTHDYEKAFAAARKCAAEFDWDAVVGNMVYVWTGLTQAIGLKYYGIPGIDVSAETDSNTSSPAATAPSCTLTSTTRSSTIPPDSCSTSGCHAWRTDVSPMGTPTSYRNNLSFLKGGMANAQLLQTPSDPKAKPCATSPAPCRPSPAFSRRPSTSSATSFADTSGSPWTSSSGPRRCSPPARPSCPHLLQVALSGADPDGNAPIAIWMHRGCVPFVSHEQFDGTYWPTLKPIIEEIWKAGHQTLFYAEGDWTPHLNAFAELPDASIVYHVDRADIFETHKAIGHKFCLSGGVSNYLLAYGTPEEVRDHCKKIIDGVARDGGYILDASAIIQNDAQVANGPRP